MPSPSSYFGTALNKLRTLYTIPQSVGVTYLKATMTKTRLNSNIVFLRNCCQSKRVPFGFRLKFHPGFTQPQLTESCQRTLKTSSLRLMSTTIEAYTRKIKGLDYEIQHMRSQLRCLVDFTTSRFIIQTVQEANKNLHEHLKQRKAHKLDKILNLEAPNAKPHNPQTTGTNLVTTIPADLHLPPIQRQVLSKGLKFVPLKPRPNSVLTQYHCHRFFRRVRLAAHFQSSGNAPSSATSDTTPDDLANLFPRPPSTWCPPSGELASVDYYIDLCERQISQLKHKPLRKSNITQDEAKALRELQDRTDIVIKPADKGGAIVVWHKDLYTAEAERQLKDSNYYSPLAKSTTKKDNAIVRHTIKQAIKGGYLPAEASRAINSEPRESRFYLLPKIHKANNPGRPIVSACACPTVLISSFLDSLFQPLVANLQTFIKDTNHTLQLLVDFSFPPTHTSERHLFTMDVVSLYTNIPHQDGLAAVKYFLSNSDLDVHIPTILRLTELVLTLNSFSFGGQTYKQTRGVAMGTKMGPSYACLFVGFVENQALSQYPGPRPSLFKRFIDDCLGVATGPKENLVRFIDHLSNFHPSLQFTHTISSSSVSFLDILISIQPDSVYLATSVFYKETDSHSYLLYSSSHPTPTKNSIPYSQFLRLKRLCSSDDDFERRAEEMISFFTSRHYPQDTVLAGLERARKVRREDALNPETVQQLSERTVAVLPFHPHNLAVSKILRHNFKVLQNDPKLHKTFSRPPLIAFRRDTSLGDLLVRSSTNTAPQHSPAAFGNKQCQLKSCKTCPFLNPTTTFTGPCGKFTIQSQFNCQSSDLIYIVQCLLCHKLYVGETYRTLGERFSEHLRSMRLNYQNPIGTHFNSPAHSLTHATVAAVWKGRGGMAHRKFQESWLINRLGTTTPAGLNTKL